MSVTPKAVAAGTASALVLTAGIAGAAVMADASQAVAAPAAQVSAHEQVTTDRVASPEVVGVFSFAQDEVSANDEIARNLAEGSRYLCGARASETNGVEMAENWVLTVGGAVSNGFSATVQEIAQTDAVQSVIMGCSCLGNPADGRATANALVTGISAMVLVEMAQPSEAANTVVFTSSDGYEVALPLSYLRSHYCPIVFDVNGSRLEQSVGGTNQLWLGSTPASYFVRDVTSVRIEERDVVPASPTSDEARAEYAANLPNVGVLLGGEVQ